MPEPYVHTDAHGYTFGVGEPPPGAPGSGARLSIRSPHPGHRSRLETATIPAEQAVAAARAIVAHAGRSDVVVIEHSATAMLAVLETLLSDDPADPDPADPEAWRRAGVELGALYRALGRASRQRVEDRRELDRLRDELAEARRTAEDPIRCDARSPDDDGAGEWRCTRPRGHAEELCTDSGAVSWRAPDRRAAPVRTAGGEA